MNKSFLIFLFFASAITSAFSQGSEIGPFIGGSYYMGELNPGKQFYRTKPAYGLIYRKLLNPRYAIKANFIYGNIEASDADSQNPFQKSRNLNFQSKIYDLSGQIEFNFLPYETNNPKLPFSPYIFAGLSAFRFNPKGNLNGNLVDLRPLSTEGQGTSANPGKKTYSLTQMAFPFGAGIKAAIAGRLAISLEWGLRKTSTDYLDDVSSTYPDLLILTAEKGTIAAAMSDRSGEDFGAVSGSQRGNSKNNDWYSIAGIALTYKIGPRIQKCPAYNK